jgi:chromosome segregation ATPase
MTVQGIEALDVLQARVTKMLDLLADLRDKRDSLQSQVESLEQEGVAKDNELAQLREEQARLLKIQEEYKQLAAEREIMRNKVEAMLKHLETFDLP